jgi:hypothetical protein
MGWFGLVPGCLIHDNYSVLVPLVCSDTRCWPYYVHILPKFWSQLSFLSLRVSAVSLMINFIVALLLVGSIGQATRLGLCRHIKHPQTNATRAVH